MFDLNKPGSNEYFIASNGKTIGPYDQKDIIIKIKEKSIFKDTQIYYNGKWLLLGEIDDFKNHFPKKQYVKLLLGLTIFLLLSILGMFYYLNQKDEVLPNQMTELKETNEESKEIPAIDSIELNDSLNQIIIEELMDSLINSQGDSLSEIPIIQKTDSIISPPIGKKTPSGPNYINTSDEKFIEGIFYSKLSKNKSYKRKMKSICDKIISDALNLDSNNYLYSIICSNKTKIFKEAMSIEDININELKSKLNQICP